MSGSLKQNLGDPGFNTLDEPIKTTIVILKYLQNIVTFNEWYVVILFRWEI